MSKLPVIPNCRNLEDVIRGMSSLRTYYATQTAPAATAVASTTKTTNTTTVVLSGPLPDVGRTTKMGRIQIRFMGLNPDGSDLWQLEVVTV